MKKLVLLHSLQSQTEFVEGVNCERIEPLDHGGYRLTIGQQRITVGPARVDHCIDEPRAGLTPEPTPKPERNGLSPEPAPDRLPRGVGQSGDGAEPWRCLACSFRSSTVHGIKVHYARAHG